MKQRQTIRAPALNERLLRAQLIVEERYSRKPYRDTAGKLTIGYGRNLDDVGLTPREALYLLDNDIAGVKEDLDRNLPEWRSFPESTQRAVAAMCFQLGWPRLSGFKRMLAALRAGDWQRAADEALDSKWARDDSPTRARRVAALIRSALTIA